MRIAVVDGQGGGLGRAIIEKLKAKKWTGVEVVALGTNSLATQQMMRAGADAGATGENAIAVNAERVDVIVGSIGIVAPDSMMGELTTRMAEAVSRSNAKKILIPYNKCNLLVAAPGMSMQASIDCALDILEGLRGKEEAREHG
ncbi:MAG: DUF3842 family protein [Eubacteriales bacterium]|jgi:NAD(P)-dependent dehydrogenase (short-subunit alcohol dehydrogenase family)